MKSNFVWPYLIVFPLWRKPSRCFIFICRLNSAMIMGQLHVYKIWWNKLHQACSGRSQHFRTLSGFIIRHIAFPAQPKMQQSSYSQMYSPTLDFVRTVVNDLEAVPYTCYLCHQRYYCKSSVLIAVCWLIRLNKKCFPRTQLDHIWRIKWDLQYIWNRRCRLYYCLAVAASDLIRL